MPEKTTFKIECTPKLTEALEEIRLATERTNRGEVIRDALELYDLVVQQRLQGKRIFIGDDREGSAEVRLPHLTRVKKYGELSIVKDED